MKRDFNVGLSLALALLVAAVGITHPQAARGSAAVPAMAAADVAGSMAVPAEADAAQRLARVARQAHALRQARAEGQPQAQIEQLADELGQAVVGLGPVEHLFDTSGVPDETLEPLSDEMRAEVRSRDAQMRERARAFRTLADRLHAARLRGDTAAVVAQADALAQSLAGQDFPGAIKTLDPDSVKRVVAKPIERPPLMTPDALDRQLRARAPRTADASTQQMMTVSAADAALPAAVPMLALSDDEAQVSPRVAALAQQLGRSPVRIYNWVRDNIRFAPTYGVLRGADQTLVARQGNAYDTSALLVALLRASGYQARYVYGTVQLPIDQVQNWLGNARTPDDALDLMLTGGIPTRYMTSGGRISALQFEHVWVEAYVDFIPSRGVIERDPDTWVPLDASFKQYRYDAPIRVLEGSGVDALQVVQEFVDSATVGADGSVTGLDGDAYGAQLDRFTGQAAQYLQTVAPEADIDALFGRQTVIRLDDQLLAGTLPYKVIARAAAHAKLPASLKNFLVLNRYNTRTDYALQSPSMTVRVPTHSLGGNSLFVDYEAATQAQKDALLAYAQRNDAQLSLAAFDVRPVVHVGDAVVYTDDYVDMGTMQLWESAVVDPHGRGAFGFEPHEYAAGSRISFTPNLGGITADQLDDLVQPLPDVGHLPLAQGLHLAGMQYWYMSDLMGTLSAKGWGGSFLRLPSVGAFAAPLQVTYFFGLPRNGFQAGYSTDIKSDNLSVALGDPRKREMMLLQFGTQASLNESLTWDILLNGQPGYSMSAASLLLRANELKVPIHTITRDNLAAVMPKLQLSAFAEQEIANAVNAGLTAIVPEREYADTRQSGAGYVLLDRATGGGVFRVDGGLNGAINVGCIVKAVSLKILCDSKMMKILTRRLMRWGARLLVGMGAGVLLGPAALGAIAVVSAVLLTVEIIMTVIEVLQWVREVMNDITSLTPEEMAELGIAGLNEAICSYTPSCVGGPLVGAAMSGLGSLGDRVMGAFGAGAGGPPQGNPISPDRGYKYQTETDFTGSGPFPLEFERRYVSYLPNRGPIGHKWASRYFARIRLAPDAEPNARPDAVLAARGDGGLLQFVYRNGAYVGGPDIPEKLERQTNLFGHTSGWTYATGYDEVETYDAEGRLVAIRNRAGLVQSLAYNDKGQLERVTDPFGRSLAFQYDALTGQLVQMTDPQGRPYAYEYDDYGSLVKVTYPGGLSRRYHYELDGRGSLLTGITDERGVRYVSWKYDARNRAIESSKAGGVETYRLAFGNNETTVVDPYGASRTFRFKQIQDSFYVTSATEPCATCGAGAASSYSYDGNGYPTQVKDFKGNTTDLRFNARGLPTSVTLAVGKPEVQASTIEWHPAWRLPARVVQPAAAGGSLVTSFAYNAQGLPETRTVTADGKSRVWRYTYTAQGQLETEDGPRTDVQDITRYAYDGQGNLSQVTDPNQRVTRYPEYSATGKLLAMVDANGTTTRFGYDERDRLTSAEVIAAGQDSGETTLYDHDGAGNLTGVRLPDGSALTYGYDDAGRLTSIHDTLGNHVAYTLNAAGDRIREDSFDPQQVLSQTLSRTFSTLGRLETVRGAGTDEVTQFGYDDNGNETSVLEPLHAKASVSGYDALDRLVASIDPLNGQVGLRYDTQDNLRQVTDPRGLSTAYTYNGFNELTGQSSPDTGADGYAYDEAGHLTRRTDARQVVSTYRYDAVGRPIQTSYPDETLDYVYDEASGGAGAVGRLTTLADGSGRTRYAYDAQGRLAGKSQQLGADSNIAGRRALGQAWTDGRRTGMSLPSGAQVAYRYNSNGRVQEVLVNGRVILTEVDYFLFDQPRAWTTPAGRYVRGFDGNGRVDGYTLGSQSRALRYDAADRVVAQGDWNYGYDDNDRLTAAARTGRSLTWQFDATGNRTQQTDGAGVTNYGIDPASNRLATVDAGVRQYDAVGNTTSADGKTFVYSGRNRMVEVKQGVLTLARYAYNGAGERVCAAATGGSCPTATSAGSNYRQYVYDDEGHLVGEYDATGALIAEHLWLDDVPVAVLKPAASAAAFGGTVAGDVAVYYVQPDHLDTPRAIVNAGNALVWQWDSAPFGDTPADANPEGLGTFAYSLRFPGQQFDAASGLYYNYFRDYEAGTGRYVQSDPIGLEAGPNTYAYVGASPLANVDPEGLITLRLKIRPHWTPAEKRAARRKADALSCGCNSGKLRKTKPVRASSTASSRYRTETGRKVPKGWDVDHIIDLQLGGCDCVSNMKPLPARVNRSFGAQISAQLRNLPLGTAITGVCTIEGKMAGGRR